MSSSGALRKQLQKTVTFTDEIRQMLFAFGDVPQPNLNTAKLVESIVLQQMRTIIREALKYTAEQQKLGAGQVNCLNGPEVIFLMRRNPMKMRRFVQFLKHRQLKHSLKLMNPHNTINVDEEPTKKCDLLRFIEFLDETGEFIDTGIVDEVKRERQIRADWISESLDVATYKDYVKACSVSFHQDIMERSKFRYWLDPASNVPFTESALLVLAYLAYQTIAEIVDCVYLMRQDSVHSISLGGTYDKQQLNIIGSISKESYLTQRPINVNEVYEVERRFTNPNADGRLNFGGHLPKTAYLIAL